MVTANSTKHDYKLYAQIAVSIRATVLRIFECTKSHKTYGRYLSESYNVVQNLGKI